MWLAVSDPPLSSCSGWVHRQFSSRRSVTQLQSLTFPWSPPLCLATGRPLCLLVYKDRDSTPPLKRRWHLRVNLTGLKQTDLKLWLTSVLLKWMWGTEWSAALRDRWRTIKLCNYSLNSPTILLCLDLLKKLLFVFNVSVCLWFVAAHMQQELLWRLII